MDMKEKLVELLNKAQEYGVDGEHSNSQRIVLCENDVIADRLIKNGLEIKKLGIWTQLDEKSVACSECGKMRLGMALVNKFKPKYCSNCGAKMSYD